MNFLHSSLQCSQDRIKLAPTQYVTIHFHLESLLDIMLVKWPINLKFPPWIYCWPRASQLDLWIARQNCYSEQHNFLWYIRDIGPTKIFVVYKIFFFINFCLFFVFCLINRSRVILSKQSAAPSIKLFKQASKCVSQNH